MWVAFCVCDTVKDTHKQHLPSPHRGAPARYVCVSTCESVHDLSCAQTVTVCAQDF